MNALKFLKSAFCFAWMPLYFGGSSESDSHVDTTNNTTNTAYNTDKRTVASDAAVGVGGDGNTVNRSETTSFRDSSDRSTHISYTSTDFGSVSKALDSVTMMGKGAFDLSDHSVTGAIDTLKRISDNNNKVVMAAFDAARGQSADSVRTAQDALTFASKATAMTNDAFAQAKNGPDTNKTVMYAAIAAVGIVGAMALRKG